MIEEPSRLVDIELILPRIIVDEFSRNKARIVEESGRSLSSTLKRAKEAIEELGDPRKKSLVVRQLNDVDHRIPMLGDAAASTAATITNDASNSARCRSQRFRIVYCLVARSAVTYTISLAR